MTDQPTNYDEATRLLAIDNSYEVVGHSGRYGSPGPSEVEAMRGNAHALLAVADELRALRQALHLTEVRSGKRHPDLGGPR